MIDVAADLTVQLADFSEDCTLTISGTDYPITGMFMAERRGWGEGNRFDRVMGGVQVSQLEPELWVKTVDVSALGNLTGSTVNARARDFTVGRVLPDELGLTRLELREQY